MENLEQALMNLEIEGLRVEVIKDNFNEIIAMDSKIHHLTFKEFDILSSKKIKDFLVKHSETLETLVFEKINFEEIFEILKVISNFQNLKQLTFEECECNFQSKHESDALPEGSFPNLLELTVIEPRHKNIFDFFTNVKSIKRIELNDHKWGQLGEKDSLLRLLEKNPNIKHLSLEGRATVKFFESNSFPFELHRLDAYFLGFYWEHPETSPRLRFLQSQQGHLKELRLSKLPYDYDGGVVLKFIIEEMNLDTFYYRDTPLIINGKKCEDVEKIWFNEVQIKAGMEMMRQFPSIKNLEVLLAKTRIDKSQAKSLLDPQTDIFLNVEELKVTDNSVHCDLVPCFSGLYKNCRNVKKFIINSTTNYLNEVLGDVLPHMTQLEELHMSVEMNEITEYIIEKSMKVQRLLIYIGENFCEMTITKNFEIGSLHMES